MGTQSDGQKSRRGTQSKNGPVRVSHRTRPWTEDEARDLLRQGYEPRAIAARTGFSLEWVLAQPVPRVPLTTRLVQRRNAS